MKRYLLIILIISISCTENGWSKERRAFLKNECIENAKSQTFDEKQLFNVCSCVSRKFIDNFSWDEYQKMINIKITNENSPELINKLQIHISSIMKECGISL